MTETVTYESETPTPTGVLIVPTWDEGHAEFAWDKKNEIDRACRPSTWFVTRYLNW